MKHPEFDEVPVTAEEERLLAAALDTLIPPSDDGRLPGAGALGCVSLVIAGCRRMPGLLAMIREGLQELERASAEKYQQSFVRLDQGAREQLLGEQAFVFPLLMQAYIAYYRHPVVLEALGLEPRPPHPLGYRLDEHGTSIVPKR